VKTKTKTPAGGPGVDFDALGSAESVTNSPPFHGERKGVVKDFVAEMYSFVPEDARIMLCQFRGDPTIDGRGKWTARILRRDYDIIDPWANVYFCVSAMKQDRRGRWRRRKDNFAGGLLLMIDDIGDGQGAKFPLSVLDPLPPTALVETSPDNFQAIYMFDSLLTDEHKFEALIRAFIREKFLGADTGMAGVNRVFRPPIGVNAKPKYGGWRVKCRQWNPENRYSIEQIVDAFGLDLMPQPRRATRLATIPKSERYTAWLDTWRFLKAAGMIKRYPDDDYEDGWIDIVCPWTDEHTDGADTGAAVRPPAPENEYTGAFRCHHSHGGRIKRWHDLTDWVADNHEFDLDNANKNAKEFEDYEC